MARCLNAHSCSPKLASFLFLFFHSLISCSDGRVTADANEFINPISGERNLEEILLDEMNGEQKQQVVQPHEIWEASTFPPDLEDMNGEQKQKVVRPYEIWEASKFPPTMRSWEEKWPDLIKVSTAQEAYGLPMAGGESDCPFHEGKGCPNYFFTIQDFVAHPDGSDSSSYLPEVFLSGEVHGDERVGPTSVMEASQLLLESAHCEGLPHSSEKEALKEARDCRKELLDKGINDVHRKWLARLVSTRRIVVTPTANGKIQRVGFTSRAVNNLMISLF